MSRLIAVLLFVLFALPHALVGQSAPVSLVPGARVRVTTRDEVKPRVAVLVARTADTLVVRWPEFTNPVSLPLSEISRLDVSARRHRNVFKGMGFGVVAGGAAGFLLGAASYQPCTSQCFLAPSNRGESGAIGGIVGGTLGLVIGTLIGTARVDDWKRVPLDGGRAPTKVGMRAQGRGIGVELEF